ncbi:hypothetical protein ABIB59_000128 [Citrobacter sp. UYEF32]
MKSILLFYASRKEALVDKLHCLTERKNPAKAGWAVSVLREVRVQYPG